MESDSYTTVFIRTKYFMLNKVVQYNILKYKLLCMEKKSLYTNHYMMHIGIENLVFDRSNVFFKQHKQDPDSKIFSVDSKLWMKYIF